MRVRLHREKPRASYIRALEKFYGEGSAKIRRVLGAKGPLYYVELREVRPSGRHRVTKRGDDCKIAADLSTFR